jgi:hypothetical protein
MLRNDHAIARLAMAQVRNGKIAEFMLPWPRQEQESAPASPEEVLAFLKSTVRKKDK